MKKKLILAILLPVLPLQLLAENPDPREILDTVRITQSASDINVPGVIRIDSRRIPFQLTANRGVITYQFQDPPEAVIVRLQEDRAVLQREIAGRLTTVPLAERDARLRDTDITLQDLSLSFLYWENAELLGEQIVGPRRTWKIQLRAPSREAPYAAVIAFVDQAGGALMQMDAYNWQGKIVRRFRVTSGQKINDTWMLKQMRVERMNPATGKVESRTYIEIRP